MKKLFIFHFFILGLFLVSIASYSQEKPKEINIEESAEVFLEEYSDDFEEAFFEALKQKGIENYDRAINLFLECKRLDSENIVVDHELAKAYLSNKDYHLARDYGIAALTSEPENNWYLRTLVEILENQNSSIENLGNSALSKNTTLQKNLAFIYYKKQKFEEALAILKKLKKNTDLDDLAAKINDSIEKRDKNLKKQSAITKTENISTGAKTLNGYKERIEAIISSGDIKNLNKEASEALEIFPSQPYFYYAQGYAFNKEAKHNDAIDILEAALDYLIDDIGLANKIYTQLSDAYNGINNSVKANMYLSKIKPGF
jgi:tetratricopeptide (TPR) repeat protein